MSLWDQLCSDFHLQDISRLIAEWRDIAPALGLTEVEENTVMRDAHTQPVQRLAMLRTWKKKHGVLATYKSLADAFTRCGRQDLVDIVTDLVQETSNTAAYNMITSNIPSPSGSIQTTTTSHNQFSSFTNQLSSHYPIPPNVLPCNPFPPYFLPVQQPVLPPYYPQAHIASYPYTLQQGNDPTCAHVHVPSDFSFPFPPNPVHLNQQYSVLPSHTNTPILHQNLSLSYEPHPPFPLTDGPPPPQPPRLDSPHLTSFTPTKTAVAHHSLAPPTPATTILSSQLLKSTAASQRVSYTPSRENSLHQYTSHVPLSQHPTPSCTPSPLSTNASQVTSYIPSPAIEHSLQQQTPQSPLSPHPTPSYTSSPLSTTTVPSPAPLSPSATTPSAVTGSSSAPAHQHSISPYLQQYVQHLKNRYISIDTPVYDKEHGLLQAKVKSFINIALVHKDSPKYMKDSDKNEMLMDRLHGHVDAIQKKKTKLRMHDVCKSQDGRLARCVLVEGAPGVGKTTFAFELCKRWAKGKILQEWPAVVIIKLRDHRTRTAQNMYDLLYHPDPEIQQAVADLNRKDGKGMLLILDGYDELNDSQRDFNSVIQFLMSRELLCQSTLMVTSRPLATRTLHDNFKQSIDQHIEVLGFTEKNIEEYIQSACGDKLELVEDFKSYLSCHPFSSALMFNPLQCAIVTDLYRSHWERGDKGFAPKTLTELYTGLVHIMLLRYLTHHPVYKDNVLKIEHLSDLPGEVSQQFKAVTELAAEGIKKRQYVFDEVNTSISSEMLGFLQREEVVTPGIGISASHNFLHLTLQEYLAAVNYSQQYSSPEQLSQLLTQDDLFPLNNFFQYYGMEREPTVYSSATHWPVVLFVAGRTKLSGVPTSIFMTGLHDIYSEFYDFDEYVYDITAYAAVNVSLLYLLYETQSPQLIQSTLVTSRKYLSVSGSSALDWFVIGYCIANSTSTWRVEIDSNDSPKYFDQLVMGLRLGPEECSGETKIGSLYISGHWTGNWKILSQLRSYAKSVTEMKLAGNKQKEQCDPEKSERKSVSEEVSACYPMLEKLKIENIESSYSYTLLSFISQHSNLHILSLNQCSLSSIATSSFIHFLQSPNYRLCNLQVTLEDCTIQIPDCINFVAIDYFLLRNTTENFLIAYFNRCKSFLLEITGSCSAINYILSQPLQFYANTLTILMLAIVSEAMNSLQIDTSLYPNLEKVDITSEDYTLLHVSVLICNRSQQNHLRILSMKRCNLTYDMVRSLIHSLQSSQCRLQEVTLDDCISDHTHTTTTSSKLKLKSLDSGNVSLEFTGYCCDISHWLSQLSSYTQLTELILHIAWQDSTTVGTLREILLYHHVLESLKIDGDEFIHLNLPPSIPNFIGLQQNNLRTLSLTGCILSSDVTRSLIHSLQSPHCMLRQLVMNMCTISTSDETQQNTISTKRNTTLRSLVTTDSLCVLTKIPVLCPVLETIKIESGVSLSLPLSIPQFIGSQQSNLHTLSLSGCSLSNDVTRSLINSLQSLHCRLYKLVLYGCRILTTDYTQPITAIVSSTTITHLLFIDENIYTPSLTALASGLKHNTTIQQLAFDNYSYDFTEYQLRMLLNAVDSSAVQKLWLYNSSDYKKWFSDYTLSRNDVHIEWYSGYRYLYNKWCHEVMYCK